MRYRYARRAAVVAAVAIGALAVTSIAQAVLTQVPVKNSPAVGETSGWEDGTYLTFTRNSTAHPKDYALYLQARAGGPVTRVNPLSSRGYPGGIDGNTMIYQQVTSGQSDLRMYDMTTQARTNPPAGINTTDWEYFPAITPDYILFLRSGHNADKVMLYDRHAGGAPTQLDIVNWNAAGTAYMFAAQMNGNYATWTKCTKATVCHVRVYDLAAGTTRTIVTPTGKLDYAGSVGTDGTVYLVRSGPKCGQEVRLRAISPLGVDTLLVQFAAGVDVTETSTHSTGTSDEVLYGKYKCSAGSSHTDLYRVTNPV